MSGESRAMSPESPDSSIHLQDPQQPPVAPLSPDTVLSILNNPEALDTVMLEHIARGLVATIHKRQLDQFAAQNRANVRIAQLEQQINHYQSTFETPPDGYEENNGRAPGFLIPYDAGLTRPAKWIKQLDDGRIAGYSDRDGPSDAPFCTDLYALPDYDTDKPYEPLPCWLRSALVGSQANFHTLRSKVADLDNWHLLAEVCRFRELTEHIRDTRERIEVMEAELRGMGEARDLCEGRLESARLHDKIEGVRNLVSRPSLNTHIQTKIGRTIRRGRPM
jgi:hypothetical protein